MAATETLTLLISAKDKASPAVKGVTNSVKNLGKASAKVAKVGIGALAVGTTAFIGVMSKAAAAANEQEQAELKLATALKNTGQFTQENFEALTAQASALQRITTVGDEATIALQSMALNMGFSAEEATKVVTASLNMEKAMGVKASASLKAMGQSLQGVGGTLSRITPEVAALTKEQLENGDAIDLLSKKYAGYAENEVKNLSGANKQLSNTFGDLMEVVGQSVTQNDALVDAVQGLDKIMFGLQTTVGNNQDVLRSLVNNGIAVVIDGFAAMINTIADGRLAFGFLQQTIGNWITSVAGAFASFIPDSVFETINDVGKWVTVAGNKSVEAATVSRNAWVPYRDLISDVTDNLRNANTEAEQLAATSEAAGEFAGNLGGGTDKADSTAVTNQGAKSAKEIAALAGEEFEKSIVAGIAGFVQGPSLGNLVGGALEFIIPGLGGAVGGVIDMIANGSKAEFDAMFDGFVDSILGFFRNLPDFFISAIHAIPELITGLLEGAVSMVFDTIFSIDFWEELIVGFANAIVDAFGSLFSKIGDFFSGIFGGGDDDEAEQSDFDSKYVKQVEGRASGGLVDPVGSYIVGENGPETFVPRQAGAIVPSGAGGGAMNVTINATIANDNPREVVRQLKDAFTEAVSMGSISQGQNPFAGAYGG